MGVDHDCVVFAPTIGLGDGIVVPVRERELRWSTALAVRLVVPVRERELRWATALAVRLVGPV